MEVNLNYEIGWLSFIWKKKCLQHLSYNVTLCCHTRYTHTLIFISSFVPCQMFTCMDCIVYIKGLKNIYKTVFFVSIEQWAALLHASVTLYCPSGGHIPIYVECCLLVLVGWERSVEIVYCPMESVLKFFCLSSSQVKSNTLHLIP